MNESTSGPLHLGIQKAMVTPLSTAREPVTAALIHLALWVRITFVNQETMTMVDVQSTWRMLCGTQKGALIVKEAHAANAEVRGFTTNMTTDTNDSNYIELM